MESRRCGIFTLAIVGLLAACGKQPVAPASAGLPVAPAVSTLGIVELAPGSGPAITGGAKAVVQYSGWLYETSAPDHKGREFDSTQSSGHPFSFVIGAGQVIKGWDQGVLGMKVGGRRRLIIPAELGYGDVGAGDVIPPGAALVFDVDLTAIE
jgi:FKBP-type peptidyl-prolyl cis-trans isomerase FkpA